MICCAPATATFLRQDNMFFGSLMIATQAVCGGMLSRSVSVTKYGPTCNYPVGLSAAYGKIARPVYNTADPVCGGHTTLHIVLISAFSEYRLGHHCTFTF